jgi:hypothetical protein
MDTEDSLPTKRLKIAREKWPVLGIALDERILKSMGGASLCSLLSLAYMTRRK